MPRTRPRMEQFIRARRADQLGLVKMLVDDGQREAKTMATALRHLLQQSQPSSVVIPGLLDGLPNVNRLAQRWLEQRGRPAVTLAQQQV